MKDKFMEFIQRTSSLKILAVLCAIIVWLMAISQINPVIEKKESITFFKDVSDISISDKDSKIENVSIINQAISVSVKGRKEVIENINENGEDFTVELDYSSITGSGKQKVPIIVKTKKIGVQIVNFSPAEVEVDLERIVEKRLKVDTVFEPGVFKSGYEAAITNIEPSEITIRGFENVISPIEYARVVITTNDIKNLDSAAEFRKICRYYDKDGKEVTDYIDSQYAVINVTAGKRVPVNYVITGSVPADYYISNQQTSIKEVVLLGKADVLDNINRIDTTTVSIDDRNESFTQEVSLMLPEGVTLLNSEQQFTVSVTIDRFGEKHVNVKASDITIRNPKNDLYEYDIISNETEAVFKGKTDILNQITDNILNPSINVSALGEGTHRVQVELSGIPNGVTYVTRPYVYVVITNKPIVTPTPTLSPTPTPVTTDTPGPTESSGTAQPTEEQQEE